MPGDVTVRREPVSCDGGALIENLLEEMTLHRAILARLTAECYHILGRAIEKCQRLLVKHWIAIAYAVSCCLLPKQTPYDL